jgi:DNA helicase-2/ATP-dependent DNA helicase PcrA
VKLVGVERKFGKVRKILCGGVVPVEGRIDRIDLLEGKEGVVRVVDYKTGRALSENEIWGRVGRAKMSAREQTLAEGIATAYLRQLLFYKMLVESEPDFPYRVEVGRLEFIRADEGRRAVSREVILEDEQVTQLKELIEQVWEEITTLKFLK